MKYRPSVLAGVVGHALEYYDIMLYGFFGVIITPLFFPSYDPATLQIASVSTFAAGFVMRPFGSIFFGHLGDRFGRKFALMLSIFLVIIPTLIIGILPIYSQIGIFAPIILVFCRLTQGFCLGGEVGGAITYIFEHAKPGKEGQASSFLEISCYIGGLFGTGIGFFCTLDFMPPWGWRIPFILGALFGILGLYIRHKIEETPTFAELQKQENISRVPFIELIKFQKLNFLKALGICACFILPFYILTTYTNEVLKSDLHLGASEILGLNSIVMVLWIVLLPFMGKLSDKIGIQKVMSFAAVALILVSFPLFFLIDGEPTVWKILTMQVGISLCGIAFSAPFNAVFSSLFPSRERCSGVGLSYSVGAALFGGMAPLMALKLVHWTGDSKAPAFLLILSGLAGLMAVLTSSIEQKKNESVKISKTSDVFLKIAIK